MAVGTGDGRGAARGVAPEHSPDADISPVGNLRRRCETCGDLDILAAGAPGTDGRVHGVGLVERVLAHGDTKSSVLLWGGFQADLRLVPRESLGAALQLLTGSKPHNHRVARSRHQRGSSSTNTASTGMTTAGSSLAHRRKRSIGRSALNIRPELRENRGEIEAAERAALPRLLTIADLRGDLHITRPPATDALTRRNHGAWQPGPPGSYIAITDHSQALAMANGSTSAAAPEHAPDPRA